MFNIGAGEITLILVVALLVLGPQRLPELARGLGKFMRAFRRQTDEVRSVIEREFYRMDQDVADFELPKKRAQGELAAPDASEPPLDDALPDLPPHDELGRPLPVPETAHRDAEGTQVLAPAAGQEMLTQTWEETPTHVGPRGTVPAGGAPVPISTVTQDEVTQIHERPVTDAPALDPLDSEGPLGRDRKH